MIDDYQQAYDGLKRLHNSQVTSVEEMKKLLNTQADRILFLETQLVNCEKALHISKENMTNNIVGSNQKLQDYLGEIELLRAEIRKLRAN